MRGGRVIVWRVRPPGQVVTDSLSIAVGGDTASVARTLAATAATVGDRIYFGANESLVAIRTRDLQKVLDADTARWGPVVKASGFKAD